MANVFPIEEFQNRLRQELEAAEREWRDANPQDKAEARKRLVAALRRFKVCVFEGKVPD